MDYFTLDEVNSIRRIFDFIYLNYKNINSYIESVDDDSLGLLLDDILNCLYRSLTNLIRILSTFQDMEEDYDE